MESYYIYRIINNINGHDYVGRKKELHVPPLEDNYYGSGVLIREAIKKYGKQNFTKEILESGLTYADAANREVYWIAKYRDEGKAYYNISPGLEGFSNLEIIDEKSLLAFNAHKAKKVRDCWKNISEEDYATRTAHMRDAWSNRDELKKANFSNKRSTIQKRVCEMMSSEEKAAANEKRKASLRKMHSERDLEHKKEISAKISESLVSYNKSLSKAQKQEISEKLSSARKTYLKSETKEHREQRSRNQSLAQGKYYKIVTPENEEIVVRALALWCRDVFKEKGPSAATTLRARGKYKGYIYLGECEPPNFEN